MLYRHAVTPGLVLNTESWTVLPDTDPDYQAWVAAGNTADPFTSTDQAAAEAEIANARLDAGISAAAGAVGKLKLVPLPKEVLPTDPVTQEQLGALQAQVDLLQQAVIDMLQAQAVTP